MRPLTIQSINSPIGEADLSGMLEDLAWQPATADDASGAPPADSELGNSTHDTVHIDLNSAADSVELSDVFRTGSDLAPPTTLAFLAEPEADTFGAFITDAPIGSSEVAPQISEITVAYQEHHIDLGIAGVDASATSGGFFAPPAFAPTPGGVANLMPNSGGSPVTSAGTLSNFVAAPQADVNIGHAGTHVDLDTAALAGAWTTSGTSNSPSGITTLASLDNPPVGFFDGPTTNAGIGGNGATAAQVQQALDESGLSVNGSGIKVGVLSDSFNDLGGATADEASGALPPAADIQVLEDLSSGGTDEGRAMMQIVHDIAPGADLAFYTAFNSEQDFANGILALASAGCKVICDDVSYFDEPFFQTGVVAQAIQTVEAEGVTYVTAAGNDASNAYQAAWTPISGSFDGTHLTDAESFGGSIVQTVTVGANSSFDVPLLLEWNQAYGAATSDLEILVFSGGKLVQTATNRSNGEPTNPWDGVDLTGGATYQIAIENLSGPNPGLIKEITEGDGLPVTISGADVGTVYGHAMTPGAITAGAVSAADTPAFGVNPALSESFSSSGAGTELLFANNGSALSSPDLLSPVAVSGLDDINTTLPGGLSDFFGTSAASASLAGVAALILSADPSLTPAQVEAIMEQTALSMPNSSVSGAGLVQVDPAVAVALGMLGPVVAATHETVAYNQSIPLTEVYSVSGSGVTEYQIWFSWPEGGDPAFGTLTDNGTPVALDQWVTVSSLSGLEFTGSATPGTDDIWLKAYNGVWSPSVAATITDQGIAAPVVAATHETVAYNQSIPLTEVYSVSGSGVTEYQIWFSWPEGGDPAFGTLTDNGTPVALDQWVTVSSLSGLEFTGSATPGTDDIWLKAYNGVWSPR